MVVTNSVGSVTSDTAHLTVIVPPAITTPPQSQTVTQNFSATFAAAASGTAPLSFQWQFNGGNISGATSTSYTRANVQPGDAGTYTVVVTNAAGPATASATLTVEPVPTPPGIIAGPQSQTIVAGQSVTFSVSPTGSLPLSYQWWSNGRAIAGATTNSYARSNIQLADAGTYAVVVTNLYGALTSIPATLTVNFSLSATASSGGTVSRSPDQPGYAPNSMVILTAATNAGFAFTGWSGDASGTDNPLSIIMTTNKLITATFVSTVTEILIDNTDAGWANTSPTGTWSTGSAGAVPKIGANYLYTAGTGNPSESSITRSCRWTPDIPAAGFFDVYVFYQIGQNRNPSAIYKVFYDGGSVSSVQNQYSSTPNQGGWFQVGTNLPFAAGTGGYVERGNNSSSTALVSADAARFVLVSPLTPPSITTQPQDQAVTAGTAATFSMIASGTAPLNYRWRRNGAPIADATASTYTRYNVQPADAGSSSVVVTNSVGSVTSSDAILSVNVPPSITSHPQSRTNAYGSDAGFSVAAAGTLPLSYQWRFNAFAISGATGSDYARAAIHSWDAGSYSVVVSNAAGSATSGSATLTVLAPSAPHIDSINMLPDKRFRLQISGSPGQYGIDGGTSPGALAELTNFNATASPFEYIDLETNITHRLYRARLLW